MSESAATGYGYETLNYCLFFRNARMCETRWGGEKKIDENHLSYHWFGWLKWKAHLNKFLIKNLIMSLLSLVLFVPLCFKSSFFSLVPCVPFPSLLYQVYIALQEFVWICPRQLCTNHELLWLPLARNSALWPVSCRPSHVYLFHHQQLCSHRRA